MSKYNLQESKAASVTDDGKKPEQAGLSEPEADKGKYQRGEKAPQPDDEEARKLKMGKGLVPDKKDDDENVKLKPIPEKQVNKSFYYF